MSGVHDDPFLPPLQVPEGPPLLDDAELGALVGVLRSGALSGARPSLQRVLANLCGHATTRSTLLAMLLDMMRQAAAQKESQQQQQGSGDGAAAEGAGQAQGQADMEVEAPKPAEETGSGAAAGAGAGGDAAAAAAAPLGADAPNDPQLRRVLETLIYLCRTSPKVSALLLLLRAAAATAAAAGTPAPAAEADPKGKGPASAAAAAGTSPASTLAAEAPSTLQLLLAVLGRPAAGGSGTASQRSSGALDMSLRLTDLLLGTALTRLGQMRRREVQAWEAAAAEAEAAAKAKQPEAAVKAEAGAGEGPAAMETEQAPAAAESGAPPEPAAAAAAPSPSPFSAAAGVAEAEAKPAETADAGTGAAVAGAAAGPGAALALIPEATRAALRSHPARKKADELCALLERLPADQVRSVPLLLARPGLTEGGYNRIMAVMSGLTCTAPHAHASVLLDQLAGELCRLASGATELLTRGAQQGMAGADSAVITGMATQGGHVLRLLRALQSFKSVPDQKTRELLLPPNPVTGEDVKEGAEKGTGAGGSGSGAAGAEAAAGASTSAAAVQEGKDYRALTREAFAALPGELKAAMATAGEQLEPLWAALSACISTIEDSMSRGPGGAGGNGQQQGQQGQGQEAGPSGQQQGAEDEPGAAAAGGQQEGGAAAAAAAAAAAGAAAGGMSRSLPPGAGQVLPLVEAFFVMCALRDAIPAAVPVAGAAAAPAAGGAASAGPAHAAEAGGAAGTAAAGAGVNLLSGQSSDMAALAAQAAATFRTSSDGAAAGGIAAAGRTSSSSTAAAAVAAATAQQHQKEEEARTAPFLKFAERHRRLLNAYLRRGPALLEGSLSPLMLVPRLIDFDNKRSWFRSKVRSSPDSERPYGSLRLAVRREHVFEDSFYQLRGRPADEIKLKLNVTFQVGMKPFIVLSNRQ